MNHITEYSNRYCAITEYKRQRIKWSRQASLTIVQCKYAAEPIKRLAAALTLLKFNIPLRG